MLIIKCRNIFGFSLMFCKGFIFTNANESFTELDVFPCFFLVQYTNENFKVDKISSIRFQYTMHI